MAVLCRHPHSFRDDLARPPLENLALQEQDDEDEDAIDQEQSRVGDTREYTTRSFRVPACLLPDREETMPEYAEQDDDDFTFPTPPQPQLLAVATVRAYGHSSRGRVSPSSPVLSAPIRRSFSAADCAASPWRSSPRAGCSPALSNYSARYFDQLGDEDEEVMDSLWEDLNNDDEEEALAEGKKGVGAHLFRPSLDVSRRRSVGAAEHVQRRKQPTSTAKDQREAAAVLAASRSSRRRPAGLVVMMRALKRMLVAHKSRSKVYRVDEQSAAAASSAPPVSSSRGKK